jgi:hypothetical protein
MKMLTSKNKPRSKTNPKKQKRQRVVNIGRPKVPLQFPRTVVKHEKLEDWANAS